MILLYILFYQFSKRNRANYIILPFIISLLVNYTLKITLNKKGKIEVKVHQSPKERKENDKVLV